LSRKLERLLVARAHFRRRDALLQPVIAGNQQFLDLLTDADICHKLNTSLKESTRISMEAASEASRDLIRVLVADDEPLFVEMIKAMLAAEDGIEVIATARNGRVAVRLAEELKPDLVVMDVSMPVMDGIEATRIIREGNPDACVMILTGGTSPTDVDRARKAGAASYLTKDRIANELVAEIRNLGSK
jgi:CheY-like chemotaxis protein